MKSVTSSRRTTFVVGVITGIFSTCTILWSTSVNLTKYAMCQIYKCGMSAWLRNTLVAEGLRTVEDYKADRISGDSVITLGHRETSLSAVKYRSTAKDRWLTALKIITVRNPFSRLVSAYYDKFPAGSRGHTYVYKAFSEQVNKQYRHMRKNETERGKVGDGKATFEDFLNFLLSQPHPENFDLHWIRYNDTCRPCEHRYDYIFKFESMNEDVRYLADRLNLSAEQREIFFPPDSYTAKEDLVLKTFTTVPPELSQKLFERYKVDFDNFGYERPKWL